MIKSYVCRYLLISEHWMAARASCAKGRSSAATLSALKAPSNRLPSKLLRSTYGCHKVALIILLQAGCGLLCKTCTIKLDVARLSAARVVGAAHWAIDISW